MKIKAMLVWMSAGFSLALLSGCGKSDTPPPPTKETTQASTPPKPEAPPKAEPSTPTPTPPAQVTQANPTKPAADAAPAPTPDTLEGLFKLVAEEEQRIRQTTTARTTDLLQKVFGALKK